MSNHSMNCREIKEIISNLGWQKPEKTEQGPFNDHLNECPDCRQLYEETVSINKLLHKWESPQPRVHLQAGIMAKIAQVEKGRPHDVPQESFWGQLRLLLGYRLSVPAFTAIVLVLFL